MNVATVDRTALETKVKSMSSDVATFVSDRAQKATAKWGVKSVSILARKL